jgi:hypothetical protein
MYYKYTLSSLQKKLNTFWVYKVDTNETERKQNGNRTETERKQNGNRTETERKQNGTQCLLSVSLSGG